MVTCPKLASQERNGAETKHILNQPPIGPHCQVSLKKLMPKRILTQTETVFT